VKPQLIAGVIPDYLDQFVTPDAPALSIAAGVSCQRLESIVGAASGGPRHAQSPCQRRQGREWPAISPTRHPDGAKETARHDDEALPALSWRSTTEDGLDKVDRHCG
jgi:pyrroline-5-carboxylate reductase